MPLRQNPDVVASSASRFTKIFRLNLPCYQSLAAFVPRLGTHPYATFELDKKLALVASLLVLQLAGQQALLFRWY